MIGSLALVQAPNHSAYPLSAQTPGPRFARPASGAVMATCRSYGSRDPLAETRLSVAPIRARHSPVDGHLRYPRNTHQRCLPAGSLSHRHRAACTRRYSPNMASTQHLPQRETTVESSQSQRSQLSPSRVPGQPLRALRCSVVLLLCLPLCPSLSQSPRHSPLWHAIAHPPSALCSRSHLPTCSLPDLHTR